jgi:two-component system, OmpR family, sensor kinase
VARARDAHAPIRRWSSGIRVRVVLASVGLLLAALVAANVVVRQVLISRLDRQIEDALSQEVEELRQLAGGSDPSTGEPFGDDVAALLDTFLRRNVPADGEAFYTVVGGEPFLTSFDPPEALLDDPEVLARITEPATPQRMDLDTDAGEARLLVVPLSAGDEVLGAFAVAFFPADERAEIDQAASLVAAVSVAVLVLASVAAWSLAGRVLRPVAQLTDTALQITETDLSARIPVEGDDELARLGHTINSMLDRLETAVVSQRSFLNDIAHDLRTPITVVRGHLEVLGDDPHERQETLELVTEELDRMGRFVSDLLVLAKAEQPDFLRVGLVDLGEWAGDLLTRVESLADRRFVLDPVPSPGTAIAEADPERLTQAVLNLVVNAVQHTGAGDEIRISVEAAGGFATVTVGDDGSGIGPELLPTLFERATRGDVSRRTRREGTGLGLAIVRAIAEAHGGTAAAASAPGEGATFTVRFPVDPAGRIGLEEVPCPGS